MSLLSDSATHLDLRGLKCPMPVLRTQKLLNRLAPGAAVIVECTDPLSVIDIPHMVHMRGDVLERKIERDGVFVFHILRKDRSMAMDSVPMDGAKKVKCLAALVFETSQSVNDVMAAFAAALAAQGKRLGGVIQVRADTKDVDCQEVHVLDLSTGARIPILQNLGSLSQSCRADSAALADAAAIIRQSLSLKPDLIFINRFGRLETEGKGMREEIGAVAASGIPVIIGVSSRYLDAWRDYADDLSTEVPCSLSALEAWWAKVETDRAAA